MTYFMPPRDSPMTMTEQEFDVMYERSLQLMDEYIATQQTTRQISDAK
jgi:hypothetical protein